MRRTILSSVLVLCSVLSFAQSTSPDALYERGMDAITGIGVSQNDALGLTTFAAPPTSVTDQPRSR